MPTRPESFASLLGCPAGAVIPVVSDGRLVVWLCGEIDLTLAPDLAYVAGEIGRFGAELTLDSSRLTFCDGTIGNFVAGLPPHALVVARRPSRLLLDVLSVSGVADRIKPDYSLA